jgi:NAD(P)-dependent dehydrogenase (short-subunit alcohol dehydrogenase family)
MEIKDQAAIVTGAASGLGEGCARALAARGCKVAVLDRNTAGAKAVADTIGGVAIGCDVSDAASAEEAIATARDAHGPARILISCAGIAPPARIVSKDGPQPLDTFAAVVNVNLIGTFNVMRLAAADMMAQDGVPCPGGVAERGVIVNTASIAAFEGQIGQAAYAASKGGVAAMTVPAAREFAKWGIRVNTIAPGIFGTPMLASLPDEVQEALAASVPFPPRLGTPEDFAALALHMVENQMMNGETVRLDGAIRLAPS